MDESQRLELRAACFEVLTRRAVEIGTRRRLELFEGANLAEQVSADSVQRRHEAIMSLVRQQRHNPAR
jgi:hypothetical protein